MEKQLDYLGNVVIDSELLQAVAAIDEFKGGWTALGNLAPERLAALRRVATIESVGSSTRIEGARLSDDEVERLLSGLDIRSFHSRDEQEVAGYSELMTLIFESWREISLTENHIKQLHGILLKYSEKDERHRGHYKTLANHVEAFDEAGRSLGVVFETATPFSTPRRMSDLVGWTRRALEEHQHHPLLVIGVFIVRFLAIHPFSDGNGRLSRTLTNLLLLRAGYAYAPFSSLERIVEDNKDAYYIALRRAQSSLDGDESQLADWLRFFVRCLVGQKDVLARRVARERLMIPLALLSVRLLEIVREHGRLTIGDAVAVLGANRNTIKLHLRQLVAAGRLIKRGRGRGTWYERAAEIAEPHRRVT